MPKFDAMAGELAHSSRIAAGLLAVLSEAGDAAGRSRALRALGSRAALVHGRGGWIGVDQLGAMFHAAGNDPRVARRVGQAIVRPNLVGLALCYGGLATAEKAYRRADHLLAREAEPAHYVAKTIDDQQGHIHFFPPPCGHAARPPEELGRLMCAVRQGMLEAIPLLYGLVPARVRESQCAYTGAAHCEFEVSWSRSPRTGLLAGAAAGGVAGLGLLVTAALLGWPVWSVLPAAPALTVLCAAAGRSIDLSRQLEAVAGARRGHLALLDQLDTALAERIDDLAKLGSTPERTGVVRSVSDGEPTGLVPVGRSMRGEALLARDDPDAETQRDVDLRTSIEAAIEALRPEWPDAMRVQLDLADDVPVVHGNPDQIDFVVEQLLRNAASASAEAPAADADASASLRVSLRDTPTGVEVAVEDDGEGLDAELLDRVFDPFEDDEPAGREGGLGLPACGRIVQRHGGELRVESAGDRGTRVAVVWPNRVSGS